jgi:hypothetical protein
MDRFFIGLHHPSDAWPFINSMVSINALSKRKSPFRVNDWILDSGAFTQLNKHGRFKMTEQEYAHEINIWSGCGNLLAAVAQDWMCEEFVLNKTGKTVEEHQKLTIEGYLKLRTLVNTYIMPVLQGFAPAEYVSHVRQYGNVLSQGQWVGVGSVCKRNGNPDAIEDVLIAIKTERPDLKLHGFGLKIKALELGTIRQLLHSSDSMAWSTAGRKQKQNANANDPRLALKYACAVQELIGQEMFVQNQLFKWWN